MGREDLTKEEYLYTVPSIIPFTLELLSVAKKMRLIIHMVKWYFKQFTEFYLFTIYLQT